MDKALITDILARTCKVNALAMKEGRHHRLGKPARTHQLPHLRAGRSRPSGGGSCANVQSRTAGRNKPLANLLFVGPTGVGKTEVAKVLAAELGIALQRFDMSEYTENIP